MVARRFASASPANSSGEVPNVVSRGTAFCIFGYRPPMIRTLVVCALLVACGSQPPPPRQVGTPVAPPPQRVQPPVPVAPTGPQPPSAEQRAHEVTSPHGTRKDPYYWLRDDTRKDPAV